MNVISKYRGVSHRDERELASLGSLRGIKLQLAKSGDGKI